MLTVRVKGKHIVGAVLTLVIVLLIGYGAAPGLIYSRAKALAVDGKGEQAQQYYDFIAERFPYSGSAVSALWSSAQYDLHGTDGIAMIYIYPSSTGTGTGTAGEAGLRSAIEKFKALRERYPESRWAEHAMREIGNAYYQLNDYDKAIKYLRASVKDTEMQEVQSTELLAKIYIEQGDYQKALDLADKSLGIRPNQNPLAIMKVKGEALTGLKQWEEARALFDAIPRKAEQIYTEHLQDESEETIKLNITNWEDIARGNIQKIGMLQANQGKLGNITGTVLFGDKPAEGVKLFLIDRLFQPDYFTGNVRDLPSTVSDNAGKYEFSSLQPGKYIIAVGVMPERIQGYTLSLREEEIELKADENAAFDLRFVPTIRLSSPDSGETVAENVTFRWEPVKGADHYDIFLGPVQRKEDGSITGTYTGTFKDNITDTELSVNIGSEFEKYRLRRSVSYNSEGKPDPSSVLGLFHPGGEYTWGVNAFDVEGNRLSSSAGYGFFQKEKDLPLFKISEEKLTKGDRLVLKGDYLKAIDAYEDQLAQNPEDADALLTLARLYDFGTTRDNRNYAKAAEYYQRLLQVWNIPEVYEALGAAYYNSQQYQLAWEVYTSLFEHDTTNWLAYHQLAKTAVHLNKPAERVLSLLDKALIQANGKYVRVYPVTLSLLLGNTDRAIMYADKVDEGNNYKGLLKELLQKGMEPRSEFAEAIAAGEYQTAEKYLGSTDYDNFLKALLTYLNSSQYTSREQIQSIERQLDTPLLSQLLRQMFL